MSVSAVGFSTVASPYPSPMPSAFDSSDTTTPAPGKDNEPITDYVIRSKDRAFISHNEECQCEKDEEDGERKRTRKHTIQLLAKVVVSEKNVNKP